jgi:predicted nucleic acid-binding protein
VIVSVDTNVWVAFLKRETHARRLVDLLDGNQVEVHPFALAELWLGNLGGRRDPLLADLSRLVGAPALAHDDVMAFAARHALSNSGIGYVDAHLLASAERDRHRLWSFDRSVATAAARLGVAYAG